MSSNIREIKKEPNPDVIKYLETCLKAAKKGELKEYRLVAICNDNKVLCSNAGNARNSFHMLGAMVADVLDYYMQTLNGDPGTDASDEN